MKHKQTLFNRYKAFINSKISRDEHTYTSSELNDYVGQYETLTRWKSWNNSPYYTTRTYQTELKQLGAITMYKRGIWQINGPIPEWFGSFHFRGLKGDLNDASNLYWNSLPAWQKVNPWEEIKQIRIEDALGAWPEWNPKQDFALRAKYPTTEYLTHLPEWMDALLHDVAQGIYGKTSLTYKDIKTFKDKATKEDLELVQEICWDWTSALTDEDDIDVQELLDVIYSVTKCELKQDKALRAKYPANIEGSPEFNATINETQELDEIQKLKNRLQVLETLIINCAKELTKK
jgi:hypothetical protein